jgi:hypothetical protein
MVLAKKLIALGACFGFPMTPSVTYNDGFSTGHLIRLNVSTNPEVLVNDSRKSNDRVKIYHSTETVYCATVPGNVLIVRRNGKVLLSGNCSPAEHQAMATGDPNIRSGNLRGWVQYRKTLPHENITKFEPLK